jgi:hypothetical protein
LSRANRRPFDPFTLTVLSLASCDLVRAPVRTCVGACAAALGIALLRGAIHGAMAATPSTGGSMNFHSSSSTVPSLLDDPARPEADEAEHTVLNAVRTWLRPRCDAQGRSANWRAVLSEAGVTADGLGYFDLLMHQLRRSARRRLDTRCRCARELAKDEASLLQTIALLQRVRGDAAVELLNDWLSEPALSGVLKIVRWFAIALLDAGLVIQVRKRRVTYMH